MRIADPDKGELTGWLRSDTELAEIEQMVGWVSPRLNIRFELSDGELEIYRPDGQRFLIYEQQAEAREQEQQRAQQAEAQLQALRTLLQERGINPEDFNP